MHLAFLAVDIHTAYVLSISLLCTISLVLLYKTGLTITFLSRYFCPFFTIVFLHYRLKDVVSIKTNATVIAKTTCLFCFICSAQEFLCSFHYHHSMYICYLLDFINLSRCSMLLTVPFTQLSHQ